MSAACPDDASFGPTVQGCRDDFDFTVKFEKIVLSIIPASVFVALTAARIAYLVRRSRIVDAVPFQFTKLVLFVAYAAVQFARLVLLATANGLLVQTLSVAASALTFVAAASMVPLSFFEHARSPRPSIILCSYLLLTTLLDIVQARTAWLTVMESSHTVDARIFTASVAFKALLLLIEARNKTRWIRWNAEEHSPEEASGIFGIGFFFWLNKLFFFGYKSVLSIEHLYPLDQRMASGDLYQRLARQLDLKPQRGQKLGLAKTLVKALAGSFLLPIGPRVALIGFTFCQPFLISSLLGNLDGDPNDDSRRNESYGLIGACALVYTGIALSTAFYTYFSQRAVYMTRGCLSAAIYKKTTEAKVTVSDDAAAVTLMSTDVERIVRGFAEIHEVWANTVEIALGCWLLQRKLGFSFLSPIIVIICCSIVMSWVGATAGKRQAVWMGKIQSRVGLTGSVIGSMKQLKISGISEPVGKLIHALRVEELDVGNKFRMVQVIAATVAFAPQCLSQVFAFALTSKDLNVSTMYESLSYLVLLTNPLAMLFQNIPGILAAFTCLSRIQAFLEADPRDDYRARIGSSEGSRTLLTAEHERSSDEADNLGEKPKGIVSETNQEQMPDGEAAISISNGSFGWADNKPTLQNINMSIRTGQLTLVVGPVACGKSTLCKAILGEVPFFKGHVTFHQSYSSIAFCEQSPFLINATLKENIIRHALFDQKRYDEVIEATALSQDIALLPLGDDSTVGSAGIALSGGQKCRVSLARALYQGSPLLVLDDILSGLDNNTESEVFRRVFGRNGLIRRRGATTVLCTHSVRHLPLADHIIALGRDGTIVEEGTFASLMENQSYVHNLGVEAGETSGDQPKIQDGGAVIRQQSRKVNAVQDALNDRARQVGDRTVYKYYFRTISKLSFGALFFAGIVFSVGLNFPNVWIGFWAADELNKSTAFYIGIYTLFRVSQLISIIGSALLVLIVMVKTSGEELHQGALTSVLRAPLSFFTTTDTGVVLNLFSQDTTIIDAELPLSLLNLIIGLAGVVGMAAVVALSSPYLAIAYPFLVALLWAIQKFYLRTSRQLRLLDLEAKSPLYANFLDTIKGVATIRAFNWTRSEIDDNLALLDMSQRPAYLLVMIQQWLTLTLNIVVALMATAVAALATQLRASSGFTGASLVTLMIFGDSMANLIRFYTLLETSIGAISRLKTFSEQVMPEDQEGEDVVPEEDWPREGRIEVEGLSASYEEKTSEGEKSPKLVLKDVKLSINTGEKVAVCGRTGSGKSSLILVLLRLLDPFPSNNLKFTIDDIPMQSIDRSTLRKRIIAVPQDCVFLPDGSSIKANVDPFNAVTDDECVSVLDTVQLTPFVTDRGGLHAGMSGEHLSAGQKQLFSLARAIIRRKARHNTTEKTGGILLLDEVSSGVDQETERLMLEIIRENFDGYTIISIAHRLDMVVRFSEKVVVLDKGLVVEIGEPGKLLEKEDGYFKALWDSGRNY